MGKSSAGKVAVDEYMMTIHFGVCSEADALLGIYVGEKLAWEGEVTEQTDIAVNNPQLFGGPKKEGGVSGVATWLPGGILQKLSDALASRFGRTGDTAPGYRSFASIFFHGGSPGVGFTWAANNPYLKGIWAKVRRAPKGLPAGLSLIGPDANPAAIVYECLTNRRWGMGAAAGVIDYVSFTNAAETLLNEEFGLSLKWTKQADIESFVSEILDHVQAMLYLNPANGKLTLRLIRGDYDEDTLPELTDDNCVVTKFERKLWGETTNEIQVTWTNPENEQEETVICQDLANISIQGQIVSDSRNYYGVRNADLAMQLAARDLRTAGSPLAALEISVDRSAWNYKPGDALRLTYPDYGIDGLVIRVNKIDYGKPEDRRIMISAMEDIFGLPTLGYRSGVGGEWVNPASAPAVMTYIRPFTVPLYILQNELSDVDLSTAEYPEVFTGVLAASENTDTIGYDLLSLSPSATGAGVMSDVGTYPTVGYSVLASTLVAGEATSLVTGFPNLRGQVQPAVGRFVFIGNGHDSQMEICLIDQYDVSGWRLVRGAMDTVPRAWPIGTPVWIIDIAGKLIDPTIRAAGETATLSILTRTSLGMLDETTAGRVTYVTNDRPHKPQRPGNVKINGSRLPTFDFLTGTDFTVTWAIRNRLTEPTQISKWDSNSVTPEVGQTTTVKVLAPNGTLLTSYSGLTGTSQVVTRAACGTGNYATVRVVSVRDGIESLQGYEFTVRLSDAGYGYNYGSNYGG